MAPIQADAVLPLFFPLFLSLFFSLRTGDLKTCFPCPVTRLLYLPQLSFEPPIRHIFNPNKEKIVVKFQQQAMPERQTLEIPTTCLSMN